MEYWSNERSLRSQTSRKIVSRLVAMVTLTVVCELPKTTRTSRSSFISDGCDCEVTVDDERGRSGFRWRVDVLCSLSLLSL